MNVIARSFKFFGITSNNILDYGSQLRHFIQNNEFVDDIEETMDDLDLNDGDEWNLKRNVSIKILFFKPIYLIINS